jgi:HME family heavy-metal exporter
VPVRHIAESGRRRRNQILRENGKRRAVVLANADGSANMTRVIGNIRRPGGNFAAAGVFTSIEGTFQAQEDASRTIGLLSLLSLATIFAIIYGRYRSAVLALIIMGSVPLALIGVARCGQQANPCRLPPWSASSP